MDPRRITEVFALHGNVMSWESHLRVVEHLEGWSAAELLDFQHSLIDHLVAGTWIRTSVNRIITLPDGSMVDAVVPLMPEESVEQLKALGHDMTLFETANDAIRSFVGTEVTPLVPPGWIGIPLHPWTGIPVRPPTNASPAALKRARRAWEEAVSTSQSELSWVLRAAPWAYHHLTGNRMPGVLPDYGEERWRAPAPPRPWGGRVALSRGSDRIELFRLQTAVSADEASVHFLGSGDQFVRMLKAKIVDSEWRPLDGEFTPMVGWGDGQDIWRSPAVPHLADSNSLLEDLLKIVETPRRLAPARRLADGTFWGLIGQLEGSAESERWDLLIQALSRKPPSTIRAFAETLAAKLFALDRPGLLEHDSSGIGLSADVHLYLRCAIICSGPAAWAAALEGPVSEGLLGSGAGERLLSVADEAFERRTGHALEYDTAVSYETGSNLAAWDEPERSTTAFVGWSVNSVEPGPDGLIDSVRFWRTDSRETAIARHREHGFGGPIVGTMGVLHRDAMTPTVSLAGVLFARAIASAP